MPKYTLSTQLKYSHKFYSFTQYIIMQELLDFQTQKKQCFKSPTSLMHDLGLKKAIFYRSVKQLEQMRLLTHMRVGKRHWWRANEDGVKELYKFKNIIDNPKSEAFKKLKSVYPDILNSLLQYTLPSTGVDLDVRFIKNLNATIGDISTTYDDSSTGNKVPKVILRVEEEEEDSAQLLNRDELLENSSLWDTKLWDTFIDSLPDQFSPRRATALFNSFYPLRVLMKYFTGPKTGVEGVELRCLLDALKSQSLRMFHFREILKATQPGELFSRIDLTSQLFIDSPKDAFEQIINEYTYQRKTIIKQWVRANAVDSSIDLNAINELDETDVSELEFDKHFYSRGLHDRISHTASRLQQLTKTDTFKIQGNRDGEGYLPATVIEIAGYFAVTNDSKPILQILDDSKNELQRGRYIAHTLAANNSIVEILASLQLFQVLSEHYDFTVDDLMHERKLIHDALHKEAKSLNMKLPSFKELNKTNLIQHDFSSSGERKRQVN